ncbi:hypothetical protein CsSME_00030931 [Camellia sinensis var. sinensis]
MVDLVLHFDDTNIYFGEWDADGLLPNVSGFATRKCIAPLVVHSCHGGAESVVVSGNLLAGFSMRDGVRVSYLLYADDAMIFCGADSEQLGHLCCVLLCFEAVSSRKVNLAKSELILVGEVGHLSTSAAILGCKVSFASVLFGFAFRGSL